MRFNSLEIHNFKAIDSLELPDLTDFVLIAGPNGCGKSCVFDAVRLLKSAYGGYEVNEWQQWFGEFQIDVSDRQALGRLFRRADRDVVISARASLSEEEFTYLNEHAEDVLEPLVWRETVGHANLDRRAGLGSQFQQHGAEVVAKTADRAAALRAALAAKHDVLRVEISPAKLISVEPNPVLEVIFQTYDPQHIGIIDYHSASRNYQREALGSVDLSIRTSTDQRRQQSLYNSQAKYQNIKTELANTYVREVIAREARVPFVEEDLNETMKELFRTFFPEKEYLGVLPDPSGSLRFPVRTASGEHDLNELSSGEKELVYGYLRLRNSAPRNSMVLLDEPELHLNPSLLRAMPSFYHRHLGQARGNQLWLVTHSDALLRSAVGNSNYSVFHMSPAVDDHASQATPVLADDELERAAIALVGDLAAYQPRSKVVIFEGGGDTEFDVLATQRLFPDAARRVNLVSGGAKGRVRELHRILTETAHRVGIDNRFFAIVDRDNERPEVEQGARLFSWDRYHIENYLLSDQHILRAVNEVVGREVFANEDQVATALSGCAIAVSGRVSIERLRKRVNSLVVSQIALGGDPAAVDAGDALRPAIEQSFVRLQAVGNELLNDGKLATLSSEIQNEVAESIANDTWRIDIPGRMILKEFVSTHLAGAVNYDAFRLLIIGRMADANYQPEGMKRVMDAILTADIDSKQ